MLMGVSFPPQGEGIKPDSQGGSILPGAVSLKVNNLPVLGSVWDGQVLWSVRFCWRNLEVLSAVKTHGSLQGRCPWLLAPGALLK